MSDTPLMPPSGELQHTRSESGSLDALREMPTCDAVGTFTPAGPTPPDDRTQPGLPADARVGKYRIVEPIGGGGMGFVYRAVNPDLDCTVALKMIRAGELAAPDALRRFERECQALARFRHSNIVTVFDAGQHQGQPFLVMEYLAGGSLARSLARYQSDPRAAVALIEKVARAVQQLHAEGVLHRDLKPANVLLDDAGEPRVGDFGLVKLLDSADELTGTGNCPGTAPYMAPEQTGLIDHPMGPPTDVWALGVMLYELLLGSRPFTGSDRSTLFHRIITQEPARPRTMQPALDVELEAVLLKCLQKDSGYRFATAGELADELLRWLQGEPTKTRPQGRLQRIRQVLARHRWAGLLVLLGLVAVLGLTVAMVIRDPERPLRRQMGSGQPVELVPERGEPAFREAIGGTPNLSRTDDGYFSVQAWDPVLLVLLRTPTCDEYRLRAKVRHDRGDNAGVVGIFVGYHSAPSPHGPIRLYQALSYSDIVDLNKGPVPGKMPGKLPVGNLPMRSAARLETRFLADIGEPRKQPGASGLGSVRFDPAPGAKVWRQLEIVVRSDQLQAAFDRTAVKPVALRSVQQATQLLLEGEAKKDPLGKGFLAAVDPDFDCRGALGLYVIGSNASFSEVVVEPLSSP